jgi:ABC-type nitrate/sulfonate/bicarbonate transport system substrate-binding protein
MRSPRNRIILIIAVALLVATSWFFIQRRGVVVDKKVVRLAAVPAAYYLPLMVAHDRNLFSKYGLRSELILFNNNNDMMNALLHGDADVSGLGSGGAFSLEAQSPGKVRFIYGQNNRSYSLIVPTQSKIQSLEDLRGKKIGTWPSPTSRVALHLILDSRIGADGFEITPVEFRFLNQAMKGGDVDALFNTDVFTEQAIQSGDARYLSRIPLEEYVKRPFFNGGGLIMRDLETRKPDAARFVGQVLEEAVKFIQEHESEARQSLVTHVNVTTTIAAKAPLDDFILLSKVDIPAAQEVAELLHKNGAVPKQVNIEPMFR